MLALILYAFLTAGLCTAAAAFAEPLLRARGLPTRILWLASMAASVVLLALTLRPDPAPRFVTTASATPDRITPAPASHVDQTASYAITRSTTPVAGDEHSELDAALLGLWGASALVGLIALARSMIRLRYLAATWQRHVIDGTPALISADIGPALVGVLHPRIVLPRWFLGLEGAPRRLALFHELEHARAGDPLLLLIATVLVRLVPWNLPWWVALRGLRDAVEMDCDARVLRGAADRGLYCRLLLDVGERALTSGTPHPALAEPVTGLERRIRAMTRPRVSTRSAFGGLAAAGILLAAACATPRPHFGTSRLLVALHPVATTALAARTVGGDAIAAVPSTAPTTIPDTTTDRQVLDRAKRVGAIADSVVRMSYPELTRRTADSPPAVLALVLDERDRVVRHAMSADPDLPERLSGIVRRLGVDTMSARTRELGMSARERWNLSVGYVVEGPGPVQGTTKMDAWRGSFRRPSVFTTPDASVGTTTVSAPPMPIATVVPTHPAITADRIVSSSSPNAIPGVSFQHLADSVARVRTPEAFLAHEGTYAIGILFDVEGRVLRYEGVLRPGLMAGPKPDAASRDSLERQPAPKALGTIFRDPSLSRLPYGATGLMFQIVDPKRLIIWGQSI